MKGTPQKANAEKLVEFMGRPENQARLPKFGRGRPAAVFVRGSHRKYGEVSGRIMAILHRYAPVVEEASIDEAYFDLSFTGSYDRAAALARQIKAEILAQERLTASIGIGPN